MLQFRRSSGSESGAKKTPILLSFVLYTLSERRKRGKSKKVISHKKQSSRMPRNNLYAQEAVTLLNEQSLKTDFN